MKVSLLKAEVVRQNFKISEFLRTLGGVGVHMSRESYYRKMRGETEFQRDEINGIAKVLGLNPQQVHEIFFND
ncbi:XRE family transcriptional regulator [Macrococcoides canis]|uniref:XRE family transcriptional regulator n=1 Tax=Macrococcoides canis TaxID=1855823 RepID=A0A1W7AER8_9STAP|nr:hypothetical protein [Macrococcus canis]ARQ08087.1 hypothetical protein MCCS_25310 [Macrococcus canis]